MSKARVLDATVVSAGAAQAVLADFPNLVWQDIVSHPTQSMVGIATLFLIIARTVRMIQKIMWSRRERKNELAKKILQEKK